MADGPATTPGLIAELAARFGDQTLVVLDDRRLTYRDAEARSAELAKGLLAAGVTKGARVGLLAPNGPDWIIGWLAATRIGAVLVPINTYHQARELAWILRHADVSVLLTVDRHLRHDYRDRLEAAVDGLAGADTTGGIWSTSHPFLRRVWCFAGAERPWTGSVDELMTLGTGVGDDHLAAAEAAVHPADPMLMVYSSGSTAEPKGAIHTHGAAIRHARTLSNFRPLAPGDRVYSPMPLFWVGGFTFTLLRAMHAGATLVFEERFEPGATLDLLEREQVTHVLGWPHMAPALANHPSFGDRDLSAIRGGSLTALLPDAVRPDDPGLRASSLGMTETLGPHLIDAEGAELAEGQRGSFGRSVPGLEHRVVDPDTGATCGPGEVGELWVRGASLMQGLHKRERQDVFTADGWYRTGDAGCFDEEGHFFFNGRLGDQIKARGMNVSPREVELVLEEMAELARAVVVGIPAAVSDDRDGEQVAAAVVLRPGEDVGADDLQTRLRDELASYKVPRHVVVLADDDELPWLDSGKVDRRRLIEQLTKQFG